MITATGNSARTVPGSVPGSVTTASVGSAYARSGSRCHPGSAWLRPAHSPRGGSVRDMPAVTHAGRLGGAPPSSFWVDQKVARPVVVASLHDASYVTCSKATAAVVDVSGTVVTPQQLAHHLALSLAPPLSAVAQCRNCRQSFKPCRPR
jgi:hypothetical protein